MAHWSKIRTGKDKVQGLTDGPESRGNKSRMDRNREEINHGWTEIARK